LPHDQFSAARLRAIGVHVTEPFDHLPRGDAKFLDIAKTVKDLELAFDVWSKRRKCAAANMVRKEGGSVWGVLYEVPDDLIDREKAKARGPKSLDEIEGEGTNYKREFIDVRCPDE
jgi:Gamma-glutamyl cyclotransferase, AIG2-like